MKEIKNILLFVDKVEQYDLGGMTKDIRKAEYLLAIHNLSFETFLSQTNKSVKIPSGMFHTGRWIVAFNIDWKLTNVNFAFINYTIDLDSNFDLFADCLSPKAVQGFFNTQEIVKLKSKEELQSVELSDDNSVFEKFYQSYSDYHNH